MIQLGTAEQFSRLRNLLADAEFTEGRVCERLGIESLEKFELMEQDRPDTAREASDALGLLIRLFLDGDYLDVKAASGTLGDGPLQIMADLGLIEGNPSDGEQIAAAVTLYPTVGVWIVSDRWNRADRQPFKPQGDVVYPAIVSNAQRFLRLMPRTPCSRMLDLCSGTAVAALASARAFAGHVWAFDIAGRSVLFAEFNRRLNGIENVTNSQGDLYEPAGAQRFDRIVAHPPYVPVLRPKWIYHDGGQDGEQIIRSVIEGLPKHLEPGGLFYMLAMTSDRAEEPYERRVRRWLGEAEDEFDIALFPMNSLDPEDFAVRAVLTSENAQSDFREFKRLFRELGVREMVYAALLIQRRAEVRPVFTIRRQATSRTTMEQMQWLLAWETQVVQQGGLERLLDRRVRANTQAELRVRHKMGPDGWEIAEYTLSATDPFSMEARTDPWAPYLMAQCDGTTTVREQFETLKQQEAVPANATAAEFARAAAVLVSGGFLLLEQ